MVQQVGQKLKINFMKNTIHFKASSVTDGYQKVITWMKHFNINLSPKDKIRRWGVHFRNTYVTLNF